MKMFSLFPLRLRSGLSFLTCALLAGAAAHARDLVHYDFEATDFSGPVGHQEWTVSDKAGPPHTELTIKEEHMQSIARFGASNALRIQAGHERQAIHLGMGQEDELKRDFSTGLVLEATFQIERALNRGTQALVAWYGEAGDNRSFGLAVIGGELGDSSGQERKVEFVIYDENGNSEVLRSEQRVEEGVTYSVRAVFDPRGGEMTLDTREVDGSANDSVRRPVSISRLRESTAPFFIGGRYDDGHVHRLIGYIDDVKIATLAD